MVAVVGVAIITARLLRLRFRAQRVSMTLASMCTTRAPWLFGDFNGSVSRTVAATTTSPSIPISRKRYKGLIDTEGERFASFGQGITTETSTCAATRASRSRSVSVPSDLASRIVFVPLLTAVTDGRRNLSYASDRNDTISYSVA